MRTIWLMLSCAFLLGACVEANPRSDRNTGAHKDELAHCGARDAGPCDAGYPRDGGWPRDAGYPRDGGWPRDAGYPRDGGWPRDAGYPRDGGGSRCGAGSPSCSPS